MSPSFRGWMISLALPILLSGSALAQSGTATEKKVRPAEVEWAEAQRQWSNILDGPQSGLMNWANPHPQGLRWLPQPPSDDMGAALTPVDASLRAQLNLPQGQGLVVTNVAPDGRAARVGLNANDILLTLGNESLNQPEDFLNVLKAKTVGATATGRSS